MKYLLFALALCLVSCTTTDRIWFGRPAEEFPGDRTKCQRATHFEHCMEFKGWKMQPLEERS